MQFIIDHAQQILQVISYIVAAAALVAAMTKTPKDDTVIRKIRKIVDLLALNVGGAKNKDE